eukprot:scaffold2059_cov33-Attheya_sp.AAC.5
MCPIVVPPDNHPDYLMDLANNSYEFVNKYQDEHFNRILRIQDNSPNGYRNLLSTMPIWDIRDNHEHFVSYTNPAPHLANLLDPFCQHPTSPCVANEENWICIACPLSRLQSVLDKGSTMSGYSSCTHEYDNHNGYSAQLALL